MGGTRVCVGGRRVCVCMCVCVCMDVDECEGVEECLCGCLWVFVLKIFHFFDCGSIKVNQCPKKLRRSFTSTRL